MVNNHEHNSSFTVLIADDNPNNITLLSRMLKDQGYKTLVAKTGKQALRIVEKALPDLVLLDIHMPEMDGYETCIQLKKNPRLAVIPVIFISALSETFNKIKAFSVGGVDYIVKPFQIEEVQMRVSTHLALRQKTLCLEDALRELKKTQSQLVRSEKLASLGTFTAGIAHELNNPINFISTSLEALRKDIKDLLKLVNGCCNLAKREQIELFQKIEQLKSDIEFELLLTEVDELTQNILDGSQRAANIIKELLSFSSAGQSKLESIDIHELIDSALLILYSKYHKQISIEKKFGSIPMIKCYSGRLSQVFLNIIDNSIQAIKSKQKLENEKIFLQTEIEEVRGDKKVVIKVMDTGPGIPEKIKGKIFDPFFTTKEVGEGLGLGLSISHGIIEEHGGLISMENQEEGGVCFTIQLPLEVTL